MAMVLKTIVATTSPWVRIPRPPLREPALELALEPFNVAGVLAQLLVGGAFADAGQGPADGLRAVVRDTCGDQRVHDVQLGRLGPDHHVGELTIDGLVAVFDEPNVTAGP